MTTGELLQQTEMAVQYEKALLGFIIQDPNKLLEISEILPNEEYFADPDNRAAYSIFLKLQDKFPGSPALVVEALYTGGDKQHFTTENEAARFVSELLDIPVNNQLYNPSAYIEYAEQIKWERDRLLIKNLSKETLSGADRISYEDRETFIGAIEDRLGEITMNIHGKEGLKHISDMTDELSQQLDMLHDGKRLPSGIMTGIDSLDNVLNGLKGGEVCVLAGRPAMGKSMAVSTKVVACKAPGQTPYLTTMGELQIGEYVFNRKGKPVEILGVFPQGKLDAYELTFDDGRKAICSEDHIWPYWQNTRRGNKSTEVINNITLKEMMERGIICIKPHEKNDPTRRNRSRFAIPICDAVEFPEQKHLISPYVLGVFLGDGCKNNEGIFKLSSELEYHVAQIAKKLGADDFSKQKGCYSWSFYKNNDDGTKSRLYIRDLDEKYEKLLSHTSCGEKYIPQEYLFDSIENRWELLRGLMDTGGSITQEAVRNPLAFSTTSKQLAYNVRNLCNSLGIVARIRTDDRRGQTHKSSNGIIYVRKSVEYVVLIRCENKLKPKFFTLEHKLERANEAARADYKQRANYDRIRLKKVEKLPEKMEMVCISVDDPEELYLCNDYLVTHNTTLSMQIAYNVAMASRVDGKKNAALIFSLEMMEEQLISRMIATVGRINMQTMMEEYQHFVNDGYYEKAYGAAFQEKMKMKLEEQYQRSKKALEHISSLAIYPTTESGLSPNSIKSMVMQKKRELEKNNEHLSLIVIDYLQLMVPAMSKANASRTEEVGDMSRKMKLLAKEFDVPVLLLAQLNRNADVTERPNLKDLRESGSIEQDADKVMFIWSENADKGINDFPEYQEDAAKREALRKEQMKVIVSVAKNRQGETGDCKVIFDKGFQTFVSQSNEYADGEQKEQFSEFFEKYYQKTRNEDIFWPLMLGEIPEAFESHRYPKYRETDYLDPATGTVYKLSNDNRSEKGAKMTVQAKNTFTPANQNTSPTTSPDGDFDRSKPSQPPMIDDLETGFEELEDDPIGMIDEKLPWEDEEDELAPITDTHDTDDDDDAIEMDTPINDNTSSGSFLDEENDDNDDDELLDLDMLDDLDDVLNMEE